MKVVFFEDVEGTALVGEVKDVKNGFARNFLLPRGKAAAATRDNLQRATALAQKEARRQEKLDVEARGIAGTVAGARVTIEARVGESGRLFGSVTNRDIAEKLTAQGTPVDAHIILLPEPIRELGERQVSVRFTRNVTVEVTVEVIPDEESRPVVERLEAARKAEEEAEAKRQAAIAYQNQQREAQRRREAGEPEPAAETDAAAEATDAE